jgi:hypothetical protein
LVRSILLCIVCLALAFLSGLPAYADEDSTKVDLHVRVIGPPMVITRPANGIGTTKAILNGYLTGIGTASLVKVSFGWDTRSHAGDPDAYAHWTHPQLRRWPGKFKQRIDWLQPGTTYYFRAKAVGDSISYGEELSFTTGPQGQWWWSRWWERWKYWWKKFR